MARTISADGVFGDFQSSQRGGMAAPLASRLSSVTLVVLRDCVVVVMARRAR